MDWQIWHKHRHLVNSDKANPLLCPDCQTNLVTRIYLDDYSPWLYCCTCDSFKKPGLNLYNNVKAIVQEHYL